MGLVIKGWGQTQASVAAQRSSPSSSGSSSPAGSLSGRPLQAGTFDAPTTPRYSFTDPFAPELGGAVMFEAPELPEETLMEVRGSDTLTNGAGFLLTSRVCQQQEHTDTVHHLRFTLDFAHCLVEVAGARGAGACGSATVQQQSLVADRISSLSRDWRSADPGGPSADPGSQTGSASPVGLVVAAMQNSWFST